jgi:hypothetical protein
MVMASNIQVAAINILYKQGSGSQGIDLVQQMPDAVYQAKKRNVVRYLKANWATPGAIELLDEFPLSLWQATNDFGDEFEVLYLNAGMDLYVEIENEIGIWKQRIADGIPEIAGAFAKIGNPVRFVAVGLDLAEHVAEVASPTLTITSGVVEEALRQAGTLIGTHGAASGLDRVHTAFHGYLEFVCQKAGITAKPDASLTDLFARLREQHPALTITDPEDKLRIDQIVRGMSRIVDALDPIRNRKTLVHPNPLLEDAEAMLAVNLIRSMLRYLDARLRS